MTRNGTNTRVRGGAVCKYPYCRIRILRVSVRIPVQHRAVRIRIARTHLPVPPCTHVPLHISPPNPARISTYLTRICTRGHLPCRSTPHYVLQIHCHMTRLYRSTPSTRDTVPPTPTANLPSHDTPVQICPPVHVHPQCTPSPPPQIYHLMTLLCRSRSRCAQARCTNLYSTPVQI